MPLQTFIPNKVLEAPLGGDHYSWVIHLRHLRFRLQ